MDRIGYALSENVYKEAVNYLAYDFKPLYKGGEEYMATTMKKWLEFKESFDEFLGNSKEHRSHLKFYFTHQILPILNKGQEMKFFLVPYKCFAIKITRLDWNNILAGATRFM